MGCVWGMGASAGMLSGISGMGMESVNSPRKYSGRESSAGASGSEGSAIKDTVASRGSDSLKAADSPDSPFSAEEAVSEEAAAEAAP